MDESCLSRFTAGDVVLECDMHLLGSIFETQTIHSAEHAGIRWTWKDSEQDSE